MMHATPQNLDLQDLLVEWIERVAPPRGAAWFHETIGELRGAHAEKTLIQALGLAPRRLGRADLVLDEADLERARRMRAGFDPQGWSVDQTARIAFLLADTDARSGPELAERLERLARTAEINELIAFYRGLPLYPSPTHLRAFAAAGMRSGIAPVFDAVAHRNPYPREMFEEPAWNQLVLKALFMERPLWPIQGLDERANPRLATTLVDYAHERWAARRRVSPELWRCVGPYADERGLAALERAMTDGDEAGRMAAEKALRSCPDPRAAEILRRCLSGATG
jgi:hypothetical protein